MVKIKRRRPTSFQREASMYMAKVVRDHLEGFHVDYIPDEAMPEFNKHVRDAICTALYALMNYDNDAKARFFVDAARRAIPNYWEQPELFEEFSRPFLCRPCKTGKHDDCLMHDKKDRVCICLTTQHKGDS